MLWLRRFGILGLLATAAIHLCLPAYAFDSPGGDPPSEYRPPSPGFDTPYLVAADFDPQRHERMIGDVRHIFVTFFRAQVTQRDAYAIGHSIFLNVFRWLGSRSDVPKEDHSPHWRDYLRYTARLEPRALFPNLNTHPWISLALRGGSPIAMGLLAIGFLISATNALINLSAFAESAQRWVLEEMLGLLLTALFVANIPQIVSGINTALGTLMQQLCASAHYECALDQAYFQALESHDVHLDPLGLIFINNLLQIPFAFALAVTRFVREALTVIVFALCMPMLGAIVIRGIGQSVAEAWLRMFWSYIVFAVLLTLVFFAFDYLFHELLTRGLYRSGWTIARKFASWMVAFGFVIAVALVTLKAGVDGVLSAAVSLGSSIITYLREEYRTYNDIDDDDAGMSVPAFASLGAAATPLVADNHMRDMAALQGISPEGMLSKHLQHAMKGVSPEGMLSKRLQHAMTGDNLHLVQGSMQNKVVAMADALNAAALSASSQSLPYGMRLLQDHDACAAFVMGASTYHHLTSTQQGAVDYTLHSDANIALAQRATHAGHILAQTIGAHGAQQLLNMPGLTSMPAIQRAAFLITLAHHHHPQAFYTHARPEEAVLVNALSGAHHDGRLRELATNVPIAEQALGSFAGSNQGALRSLVERIGIEQFRPSLAEPGWPDYLVAGWLAYHLNLPVAMMPSLVQTLQQHASAAIYQEVAQRLMTGDWSSPLPQSLQSFVDDMIARHPMFAPHQASLPLPPSAQPAAADTRTHNQARADKPSWLFTAAMSRRETTRASSPQDATQGDTV